MGKSKKSKDYTSIYLKLEQCHQEHVDVKFTVSVLNAKGEKAITHGKWNLMSTANLA